MTSRESKASEPDPPSEKLITGVRVTVGLIGIGTISYGLFLALTTLRRWPDVFATALWFGLPPVIFDLLVVPLIGILGTVVVGRIPRRSRPPVIIGLIVSAALLAVGLPFLAGFGQRPDNPSVLDRPYLLGVVIFLAVIWAAVAAWALLRRRATTPPRKES